MKCRPNFFSVSKLLKLISFLIINIISKRDRKYVKSSGMMIKKNIYFDNQSLHYGLCRSMICRFDHASSQITRRKCKQSRHFNIKFG